MTSSRDNPRAIEVILDGVKHPDLILLGAALLGGSLFLATRSQLWPETGLDLVVGAGALEERARLHDDAVGLSQGDWSAAARLDLDVQALSWLESTRSVGDVRSLLQAGAPVYRHVVQFKRRGHPSTITVQLRPDGSLDGWTATREDDVSGPRLDSAAAWNKARTWLLLHLDEDPALWLLRSHAREDLDSRSDHEFLLERTRRDDPSVRERMRIEVAGGDVIQASHEIVVPPSFLRERRAARAPSDLVGTLALSLFASLGVAAFLIKLRGLREGLVGLRVPAAGAALVLVCLGLARILRPARIMELWDPMGPQWMAMARILFGGFVNDLLPAVLVFAFLGASDALDRAAPRHRGIALRNFLRLRWNRVDVGHASLRGFLLGLVAGGVLATATWALSFLPGARIDIQPRGFFFHGINSAFPTIVLSVYFLQIALVEELGYRHFAGNLLLKMRLGRIAAAVAPALLYGAVHANLDFLPPGDPWWARIVPITLVGILWGFAFVRWDALTVVLSHWACDLFLFNQPRLSSASTAIWLSALACIAIPLLPAAVNLSLRAWKRIRHLPDEDWKDEKDFEGTDPAVDVGSAFDAFEEASPSSEDHRGSEGKR